MERREMRDNSGSPTFFERAWEVLFPYLLYYLAYSASYIILVFALRVTVQRQEAYAQWVMEYGAAVSGLIGGLSMLLGSALLLPMLKRELLWRAAEKDTSRENSPVAKRMPKEILLTVLLAAASSLGLNMLLTLTGFADSSQTFREVAKNQYGVPLGMGLILYGMVSPLAEEIVFRGIIYNRLRRLYGAVPAVAASGILFGIYHGNLVQGVYGACIGMLIAYQYGKTGRFTIPVIFHAAANLTVYVTANMASLPEGLFSPAGCVILLAVSAACILWEEKA